MSAGKSFYVTGGTLQPNALCYVERRADALLFEALQRGEFCYVLTSRQMGKSSLMAHTRARLVQAGVKVAALDLTALGQNLTPEQWYEGLLGILGVHLDLEDELDDFWFEHERMAPLQRWMAALREVVLPRLDDGRRGDRGDGETGRGAGADFRVAPSPRRLGRPVASLVVFIDEIDTVRSLPFSTDEFFAAIRECYNRRVQDAAFEQLTFCLLGVATPSDLIRDVRMTPFNIGTRIELTDFSEEEAAPLRSGLALGSAEMSGRSEEEAKALLERVLHWTGGHPYLTQRLCQSVAEDASVWDAVGVDRVCEELFLSASAREKDDNLLFVRQWLLNSQTDQASLLDLYGKVRAGKPVRPDDTNPLLDILRLSGITRLVDDQRGDGETEATGRRGDRKARSLPSPRRLGRLGLPVASLVVRNRIYAQVFDRAWVARHMPDAEVQRQKAAYRRGLLRATAAVGTVLAVVAGLALTALRQTGIAREALYTARMNLIQSVWESGNVGRVQELLAETRGYPRRGFERGYWNRLSHRDRLTLTHAGPVTSVSFSPDGRRIVTGSYDKTAKVWDAASGQELLTLKGHTGTVNSVSFSPDGRRIVTGSVDGTAKVWDATSGRELLTLKVWDAASGRELLTLKGNYSRVNSVSFSPDGQRIVTGSMGQNANVWDAASGREILTLTGYTGTVLSVSFSPDGRRIVTGSGDQTAKVWDAASGRELLALKGHNGVVWSASFSPDGRRIVTGSEDQTAKVWDATSGQELLTLKGHTGTVNSVSFSPDGQRIVTGSQDGTAKVWISNDSDQPGRLTGVPARR